MVTAEAWAGIAVCGFYLVIVIIYLIFGKIVDQSTNEDYV